MTKVVSRIGVLLRWGTQKGCYQQIEAMLASRLSTVHDADPTLKQHCTTNILVVYVVNQLGATKQESPVKHVIPGIVIHGIMLNVATYQTLKTLLFIDNPKWPPK